MFRPGEGLIPAFRIAVGQYDAWPDATGTGSDIEGIGRVHASRNVNVQLLSKPSAERNG